MTRTFIIAEAGSTHDGDIERADRLISTAKACGADAVKFQWWSSSDALANRRKAEAYREVYRKYQMPVSWLPSLKERCDECRIDFLCTVYLSEDIATVAPYVSQFKIASFESGDRAFLTAHLPYNKPVIVSTGMAGVHPLSVYRSDWAVLHCVSAYPAPIEDMNLAVLRTPQALGVRLRVGLSDHTRHPWTGALAAAAGATILERHLRLDDTDPANPDYAVASEPALFKAYVENVRLCEAMLGDGVKRQMPSEAAMAAFRVVGRP